MPEQTDMFSSFTPESLEKDTLQKAKEKYSAELHLGESPICPCCERRGKIYKRRVNANVVRFLIRLVAIDNDRFKFHHIRDIFGRENSYPKASTDASYLTFWNLLMRDDDGVAPKGGLYKPTYQGVDFVRNKTKVPAYGLFFDNKLIEFSADVVDVKEALGTKFDYEELMGWKP